MKVTMTSSNAIISFLTLLFVMYVNTLENVEKQGYGQEQLENSILERACNAKQCNEFCKRLGLPGGKCKGNHCSCNSIWGGNPYFTQDEIEIGQAQLDTSILERACNAKQCTEFCKRLGLFGGKCKGNRCRCDSIWGGDDPSMETSQ